MPSLSATTKSPAQRKHDMQPIDSTIVIRYNSTLLTIDETVISEITNIISRVLRNNDMDITQEYTSTQHIVISQELIIQIVYHTFNESDANSFKQYILDTFLQDLIS